MFERYSESAKRALFFARYEASEQGGLTLDTEHILLGIMREGAFITWRALERADAPRDGLREELRAAPPIREKVGTSVEMPFSAASVRVLHFAAEEADGLADPHIGPEHLLLGLLRDAESLASATLVRHGLTLDDVRKETVAFRDEFGPAAEVPAAMNVEAALDRIRAQVGDLGQLSAAAGIDVQHVAFTMVRAIQEELDLLKRFLGR